MEATGQTCETQGKPLPAQPPPAAPSTRSLFSLLSFTALLRGHCPGTPSQTTLLKMHLPPPLFPPGHPAFYCSSTEPDGTLLQLCASQASSSLLCSPSSCALGAQSPSTLTALEGGIRSSFCRQDTGHSPRELSACLSQDHTPGNARVRE